MIAHTISMLTYFHLFFGGPAECCRHTVNPPPPSTQHLSLLCPVVWLRWGAGSTQERGIRRDGRELLGVDFRQPLGEFEGSGQRQSSRDESTSGGKVLLDTPLQSGITTLHPARRSCVSSSNFPLITNYIKVHKSDQKPLMLDFY